VNCAPVIPETLECAITSGIGSNFHSLVQKYANPDELCESDALKGTRNNLQSFLSYIYVCTIICNFF
jgi:hypothetical protein